MARLYADENFPLPAVVALRARGHDVLTIQEAGRSNRFEADAEVLRFATADDRAVLTHNRRHFRRLHRATPDHGGIVICTVDPNAEDLAVRIHETLTRHPVLFGALILVRRPACP